MSIETKMLETTLERIAQLLNIGFGEAGTEIIAANMRAGGRINVDAAGHRIRGAFGFCDIRQFTDVTGVCTRRGSCHLCSSTTGHTARRH